MSLLADWSTASGEVLLHVSDAAMMVLRTHVQTGSKPEAGGILLGTVHDHGMLITHATAPTRLDQRLPTFFSRSPRGHSAIAQRLWRATGGTTRYLGDWHTHPEDAPSPSGVDLREWRKLAIARNDARPALSVIVGRHTWHVELMHANGKRDQLAPVV